MAYYEFRADTQADSLMFLRDVALKASTDPAVRKAALILTSRCAARDDLCELRAIFNAVKEGDDRVPGLANGVRYVSDPQHIDHFSSPRRLLKMCEEGACAEDCDGHAALIAALGAAVGFRMGLRAYGKRGREKIYTHVYAVAAFPKLGRVAEVVGLDTTVPSAEVGWEPPRGNAMTAWLNPLE